MINRTVIYVFFDNILKFMNHKEPESRKTTNAEIMTVVLLTSNISPETLINPFVSSAVQGLCRLCSVEAASTTNYIKSGNSLANCSFTRDKSLKS